MNPSTEKKIDELLSKMTLHEKVGQLVQYRNNPNEKDGLREMITRGEFGSFLCATGGFGEDEERMEKNREYVNDLQRAAVEESRLGIPLIFGKDVIHGHNTIYPLPIAMAASFNPDLVRECYSLTAGEAANDGIMWSFAPMIDLARDPKLRWAERHPEFFPVRINTADREALLRIPCIGPTYADRIIAERRKAKLSNLLRIGLRGKNARTAIDYIDFC